MHVTSWYLCSQFYGEKNQSFMDLSVQSCVCVCGGVRACMHVRFCIFSSLSVLTTVHYRGYQSFNLLREVSTAKKKNCCCCNIWAACWTSNAVQLCLGLSHSQSSVHSLTTSLVKLPSSFLSCCFFKGLNISSVRHVSLSILLSPTGLKAIKAPLPWTVKCLCMPVPLTSLLPQKLP